MTSITKRTAPAGARMMAVVGNDADRAHAAAVYLRCHAAGRPNAAMGFIRQGTSLAQVDAALNGVASSSDPTPDAPPNTPPDTGARLDAQDAQLQDHEQRIAALEERSPPPQGLNDGKGQTPAEASAVAPTPAMVDSRAIYARMNGRLPSSKAAAPAPAVPEQIQPGQVLDGRAVNARFNALAALRSGRAA